MLKVFGNRGFQIVRQDYLSEVEFLNLAPLFDDLVIFVEGIEEYGERSGQFSEFAFDQFAFGLDGDGLVDVQELNMIFDFKGFGGDLVLVPFPANLQLAGEVNVNVYPLEVELEDVVQAAHHFNYSNIRSVCINHLNYSNIHQPSINILYSSMSWYNTHQDTTKRLEQLIEMNPSFQQLLDSPDFIDSLRSFHPKLLDYITYSNHIPKDILKFITQEPLQTDNDNRKYKLPYHTMLAIETNTTCIINSFFKTDPSNHKTFFINAFYQFLANQNQLLPLLCGYFSQFNLILWNNKYKETVDLIYEAKQPLFLLAKHCYSKAIINTLLLYLNLDLTKNNAANLQRSALKLQVIKALVDVMRESFQKYKVQGYGHDNQLVVQNIGEVFIEIIEKYYLIADGKNMLEIILSSQNVALIMQMLMHGGQIAISVCSIATWLIRYYSLSSYNTEDPINLELNKRNQERLESQPFIKIILELFPQVSAMLQNASSMTLYHSKLMDIFNLALELSSPKLRDTLKKTKYIEILIGLLFKFPRVSIVHKMIEKVFVQLFNSEKQMGQAIKKYLFCEACLIQITVGQYLSRNQEGISGQHEGYFPYLMRIIKNYSKIQTNDEQINQSIMKRSILWQRFSSLTLKPYEQLCYKDLGSYEHIKERTPLEYTVKCIAGNILNHQQINKKVLEEINREQSIQPFKTTSVQRTAEECSSGLAEDNLFNVEGFNIMSPQGSNAMEKGEHSGADRAGQGMAGSNVSSDNKQRIVENSVQSNPFASKYQQFLNTKKQEVDKQLKLIRNNSTQKRLSANKSRVQSPSPKKKKWQDTPAEEQKHTNKPLIAPGKSLQPISEARQSKKQKIGLTTVGSMRPPLIPHIKSTPAQHKAISDQIKSQGRGQQEREDMQINAFAAQIKKNSLVYQNNIENEEKVLKGERSASTSQLIEYAPMQQTRLLSKSLVDLSGLKDIRFRREKAVKPSSSQFRKVENKDRVLLDFLGVKY